MAENRVAQSRIAESRVVRVARVAGVAKSSSEQSS